MLGAPTNFGWKVLVDAAVGLARRGRRVVDREEQHSVFEYRRRCADCDVLSSAKPAYLRPVAGVNAGLDQPNAFRLRVQARE